MKNSLTALREISKLQQQQLQTLTKGNNLTISEWQLLLSISNGFNKQETLSKNGTGYINLIKTVKKIS